MSLRKFFKRYPLILAFLILIAVTNIWAAVQHAKNQPAAPEASMAEAQPPAQETQSIPVNIATATTAAPVTSFQTVDASYFDDALFIGDSRTEGLALYGSLTNADYFTNIGISIFQITEKTAGNPNIGEECTLAQKLSQKQYGKIYIMLGINELGTGTTESWIQAYSDVITQIRQAQPSATIYLQSIMMVSAAKDDPNGSINNATIHARNDALRALENVQNNIYYLNVNEAVTDASGCLTASYTSDGIHLLGTSLPLWEDYLKQHAIVPNGAIVTSSTTTAVTVVSDFGTTD